MEQQQLGEVIPIQFFPSYGLACRSPLGGYKVKSENNTDHLPTWGLGVILENLGQQI